MTVQQAARWLLGLYITVSLLGFAAFPHETRVIFCGWYEWGWARVPQPDPPLEYGPVHRLLCEPESMS